MLAAQCCRVKAAYYLQADCCARRRLCQVPRRACGNANIVARGGVFTALNTQRSPWACSTSLLCGDTVAYPFA